MPPREVKNILRSTDVQRVLATKGVVWNYIIEKAPWHGGFWERMIQCTKRYLKKSLGRTSLGFEVMRTLLVEIETTINNRPITYIYDDEDGVSYPLTPSQLIYGRQIELAPNARQFAIISTNQSLTKRAKYQMSLLKHFTNCWRKEYLIFTIIYVKLRCLLDVCWMFEQFDSPRAQALARQRKRARGLRTFTCLQYPTKTSRNIAF